MALISELLRALPKFAIAFLTGLALYHLRVPLAWLLGPLLATAVMSLSGHTVPVSTPARRIGQIVIGISIGLHVTSAVILSIIGWIPVMAVAAFLAIVVAALLSVFYARLARIDDVSAYYALLPGGLSEMANVGMSEGAMPEAITIGQTLRVAIVVLLLPPIIFAVGIDCAETVVFGEAVAWWTIPILIAIGAAGVSVTRRIGIENSWMTGSLIAVGAVSALGWPSGQMIPAVFWAAQFLIGINIGARFGRDQIVKLPRVTFFGAIMVVAACAISMFFAIVLSLATGVDFATLSLALAPGGVAEMASTAQALHLSLVLITGFHLMRALMVNGLARTFRHMLEKSGFLPGVRRTVDSWFAP